MDTCFVLCFSTFSISYQHFLQLPLRQSVFITSLYIFSQYITARVILWCMFDLSCFHHDTYMYSLVPSPPTTAVVTCSPSGEATHILQAIALSSMISNVCGGRHCMCD